MLKLQLTLVKGVKQLIRKVLCLDATVNTFLTRRARNSQHPTAHGGQPEDLRVTFPKKQQQSSSITHVNWLVTL